jgi:hypothetical protein
MATCFQQSHEAYSRREGALAKELSEKGKKHERTMEALNAEASAWIFRGMLRYFVSTCLTLSSHREQFGLLHASDHRARPVTDASIMRTGPPAGRIRSTRTVRQGSYIVLGESYQGGSTTGGFTDPPHCWYVIY